MATQTKTSRFSLYPTQRAVWLLALGIPIALLIALLIPALWAIGAAWAAGVFGLILFDALLAVPSRYMTPFPALPARLYVGTNDQAHFRFDQQTRRPPRITEFKLSANERLDVSPETTWLKKGENEGPEARFNLTARRRGDGVLEKLWSRWQGPLGLIWMQKTRPSEPSYGHCAQYAACERYSN